MQHFMRGSMAGLSLLASQIELDEVIACFHKCKENLEAPPMELLQPGMEILNNNGRIIHKHYVPRKIEFELTRRFDGIDIGG